MVCVKESIIHGYGLFALQDIRAGEIIGLIECTRPTRLDSPYVLWLDDDRPVEVINDMKYINHSDDANAAYYDDLTVVALRDIRAGEEITHDYLGDEEAEAEEVGVVDFAA